AATAAATAAREAPPQAPRPDGPAPPRGPLPRALAERRPPRPPPPPPSPVLRRCARGPQADAAGRVATLGLARRDCGGGEEDDGCSDRDATDVVHEVLIPP